MASSLLLFDEPSGLTDLVHEHQTKQAQLSKVLTQDLAALWPLLNKEAPSGSWPEWATAMVGLIRQYGQAAAALGSAAYLAYRVLAAPRGARFTPPPVEQPDPQQITRSLGWATRRLGREADSETVAAAKTQVNGSAQRLVANTGRRALVVAVDADPEARGWARVTDADPCYFCALLAGRGAVFKSESAAGRNANRRFVGEGEFKFHDHCLVGETVVSATSVELAHRRTYEGEVVILGTASGAEVAITPNHPVLTRSGWVPAGRLREGDDVVRRVGSYSEIVPGQVPHQDQVPARIEDVWRAHAVDGLVRVPEAAEDFHGDGQPWQGDVDVVGADSEFLRRIEAAPAQRIGEFVLPGAGLSAVAAPLARLGGALVRLGVSAGTEEAGAGRVGALSTLLRGHARSPEFAGLLAGAGLDAGLGEPAHDGAAGDSVVLRQGEHRFAALEALDELGSGMSGPVVRWPLDRRKFDPPADEGDAQALAISAQLGADLIERLAGAVSFDRVVDVRRGNHHGYVYNLSTDEGWYDANGLVVSNCECIARPIFKGERFTLQPHIEAADELYQRSTAHVSGTEKLREFRRAYENR